MLDGPRYLQIQRQVLELFQSLSSDLLRFPLNIKAIIKTIHNCRVASYQQFSDKFCLSIEDVFALCSSKDGCTHYDIKSDKYLILYNSSPEHYNVEGRQLWTLAHELGHIVMGHVSTVSKKMILENSFFQIEDSMLESEADYFASQILAPLPLYDHLNLTSPIDVHYTFGLSAKASLNQFSTYLSWKKQKIRNPLEQDLLELFLPYVSSLHH